MSSPPSRPREPPIAAAATARRPAPSGRRPRARADGGHWVPGDAPSQRLQWAVRAVARAGTTPIIRVSWMKERVFPRSGAVKRK
ncbi:hypothetical protein CF645_38065 [Burkholderia pseudomallei]|nr:hypothetical protein CF645_38065 [Burkholderia pseudomallei]